MTRISTNRRLVDTSDYILYVPEAELAEPHHGHQVILDYWWIHKPDKGLVFWTRNGKEVIPQAFPTEDMAENLRQRMYPSHELKQVHLVFMPVLGLSSFCFEDEEDSDHG